MSESLLIKKIIDHSVFRCGINGDIICSSDWKVENLVMKNFDFWYIVSGRGKLSCNGTSYNVQGGELYFFKPGDNISATQELSSPLHVHYCHFDVVNNPLFHLLEIPFVTKDTKRTIAEAFKIFHEENSEITNFNMRLLIYTIFQTWLKKDLIKIYVKDLNSRHLTILLKAIDYFRLHLDQKIDLENLSKICGMERSGLSRLFKEYTGKPPILYHTELRIQHSIILIESGFSVKETAPQVGYNDAFSFSKAFKKHMGFNPSEFFIIPEENRVI